MKTLIPEIVPAHNKGEEAILRGIQATLEDLPIRIIYLYSVQGDYDQEQYGEGVSIITESLVPYARLSKWKKLQHISKHLPLHVVYALIRKISKRLAVFFFRKGLYQVYNEIDFVLAAHDNAYAIMHNALILFCRFLKIPVIIYATSIKSYVYERPVVKHLTRFALNRADLVTTREPISYDILREKVGVRGDHVKVTGDKAFLVKPAEKESALSVYRKYGLNPDEELIIGMTVVHKTDVFLNCLKRIDDLSEKMETHWRIMARFADYMIEETGAKVVFFPHSIGPDPKSDDRIAARGIREQAINNEKIILIEEDYTVTVLKRMISCCEFFVSERTHASIGAASTFTPFVSLTYRHDFRTYGILGKTAGMERWLYDLGDLTFESLCRFFDEAWEERTQTRAYLEQHIPDVTGKSMLNKEYLMQTLAKKKTFHSSSLEVH